MDPFNDPHSIAHQLDFSFWHQFRSKVHDLFASTVNPVSPSSGFILVASFGRSTFRLDPVNVNLAISSCTRAAYDAINVIHIAGNVFRFSVCSKVVGFHIVHLKYFTCNMFKCRFHLWSGGGPNWIYEERLWYKEQGAEWHVVSYKRRPQNRNVPVKSIYQRIHNDLAIDPWPNVYPNDTVGRNHQVLSGANSVLIGNQRIMHAATDDRVLRSNEVHSSTTPMHNGSTVIGLNDFSNHSNGLGRSGNSEPNNIDTRPNRQPNLETIHIPDKPSEHVFCPKCLGYGHYLSSCCNSIRCRCCYGYNHIARFCLNKKNRMHKYRVKQAEPPVHNESQEPPLASSPSDTLLRASAPPEPTSTAAHAMACYPCNRYPHLPAGTTIIVPGPERAQRGYFVLGGELLMVCEEWAIATLVPGITPEEFPAANAMISEFLEARGWRINYTSRCGMSIVLIQFTTACSRDFAISNSPYEIGDSVLCITRHDRSLNYCSIAFTHDVWLMLMNYCYL